VYVANANGDNVTVVDARTDAVSHVVPVATHTTALSVAPGGGTLYVALPSADEVAVYSAAGEHVRSLNVAGYPYRVAALPDGQTLAVLTRVPPELRLITREGQVRDRFSVSADAEAITLSADASTLYAGGLALDLATRASETLHVRDALDMDRAPAIVVQDTRRNRLYAVAHNGIPGTNGARVVYPLYSPDGHLAAALPGRPSVIEMLYDADQDWFYTTHSRHATAGLQVSAAEDGSEIADLPLPGLPTAMVLSPTMHHLWLAVNPTDGGGGASQDTLLIAIDTRNLGQATSLQIAGPVDALAVDDAAGLVYAASGEQGVVYIVHDVPLPAPPLPTSTPTPAPATTPTPAITTAPAPRQSSARR
jgi:hypothetical protein